MDSLQLQLLALLFAANGAPVVLKRLLGHAGARPIDGGILFADGRPALGASKTWRGLLTAILLTTLIAVWLGFHWWLGALIGSMAMAGDLLSSFTKRRLGIKTSGFTPGLDQIPEALLPLLAVKTSLGLSGAEIVKVLILFTTISLLLSYLLNKLGIKSQPY